jgi:hypothetical protein
MDSKTYDIDIFSKYFSGSTTLIDQTKMIKYNVDNINKTLIDICIDSILDKYSNDSILSFDPVSRTFILMLFHMIIISADKEGFQFCDASINSYPKKFDIGSPEKNLWTWLSELVDIAGGWEIVENIEINKHMDEVIKTYETDYKVNIQSAILSQVLFTLVLDLFGDLLFKLSPTTDFSAKGISITCKKTLASLPGFLRVMSGPTTNTEIFSLFVKAAECYPIAKKIFIDNERKEKKLLSLK